MFAGNRVYPLLQRGIRIRNGIITSTHRFLSYSASSAVKRRFPISKGVGSLLVLGGFSGALYYFFDKTSRFELFEYARDHKNTILKDGSWRSAVALGLVDLYRTSGNEVITLMHCGRFLGKLIAGDIQYVFLIVFLLAILLKL